MKRIIVFFIAISLYNTSEAQVKIGIMTGLSPNHIDVGTVESVTLDDSLLVSINGPKTTWLFGPYMRLQAGIIFVQGGVLLGYSPVIYDVDDLKTNEKILTAERDIEWYFDVPIELGVNLYERLSVTGGIVGTNNFIQEQINPFLAIDDTFLGIFRDRKFGYRFGLTYDLDWSASFSINYSYFPDTPSTIVVYDNVEYNSNIRQQQVMINFSWNFIRRGWE